MKILLFGEYSNVHHTLCEALRRAGHEVLLISDGDGWKDYPRDIDLRRRFAGPFGSLLYVAKLLTLLPRLKGFDVVQLINPDYMYLKPHWNRWLFDYLKRHNRMVSLGCFGDDYYVVSRMQSNEYLDYTDFFAHGQIIDHPLNQHRIKNWCESPKKELSEYIAAKADCLLACLYEYYKVYDTPEFQQKLHYMPLPVELREIKTPVESSPVESSLVESSPVRVLLAVQSKRALAKGTDQIGKLLQRLAQEHPAEIELHTIESVPFEQYCREIEKADVIVDQLYSYTPAMTALEAMSRGKVVISGGERYELEGISYQAPCINLRPFEEEENYRILEETLLDGKKIAQLSKDSQAYIRQCHAADDVARKCVEIWSRYSSQASSR